MPKIRGIGGKLALSSSLFESIDSNKKECEKHLGDFDFYNPDCELYIPDLQDEFFYFDCEDSGSFRRGIVKKDGLIVAFANFDDALILSTEFILIQKDNKFGFINTLKPCSSLTEYKNLDLQPTLTLDKQNSPLRLAALATKTNGFNDFHGALDEFGYLFLSYIPE